MNVRTMAAVTMAVVGISGLASAATGSFSLSPLSGYMWRGQYYSDEPVLQPSITVSDDSGLSLNTWGNMDLTDNNDASGEYTELDVTLSYALPIEGPVSLSLGFIQYTFPAAGGATRELYATIGVDAPLSPTLSVYADVDEATGFYGLFGLSHSFDLAEGLSLGLSASIAYATDSYNEFYFGVDDAAFNDVNAGVSLTYAFSEKFSLAVLATYTTLIDSDIKDGSEAIGYDDTKGLVGGLTATYNF